MLSSKSVGNRKVLLGSFLFLATLLGLHSASASDWKPRLIAAAEAYEKQFYGHKTVVKFGDFRTTYELSEDGRIMRVDTVLTKDGVEKHMLKYVSLEIGQAFRTERIVPSREDGGQAPSIVEFLPTAGPTVFDCGDQGISNIHLGFVTASVEPLRFSKFLRDSDIHVRDANRQIGSEFTQATCVHPLLGDVEIEFDDSFRRRKSTWTKTFTAPDSQRKLTATTTVQIDYSKPHETIFSGFSVQVARSDGVSAGNSATLESLTPLEQPLPDTIQFDRFEMPDGMRVSCHEQMSDRFVMRDGIVVALVDSSVISTARAARLRSGSTGLGYYVALTVVLLVVLSVLVWKRGQA
ncbi:MAG: hypothetical protein AAF802_15195 [Planctomycetota bacterium]